MLFDMVWVRKGSEIGEITLDVDFEAIEIDITHKGNTHRLPASSVKYFLEYGFTQAMTDAYNTAGKFDDPTEAAKGLWEKRLNAAIDGTVATRTGGSHVDEVTKRAREMAEKIMRQKLSAAMFKEKFVESDGKRIVAAEKNARLDMIVGKLELMEKARKQLEEERQELAGADIDLDFLND